MAPVPEIAEVLSLAERFPNFSEPIQYIAEQAALSHMRGAKGFRIPPLLLVGPPGIGKTHLAQSLADVLGSHVEIIGMSSATGGFALSGVDRGWATAKAGMIYSAIANGESLAPVVVLDEIDKANSDSKSDPVGPLYQLLEPRTAVAFRDEFVGFGIDASHVVWIATANDLDRVPTALRSRFHVFHIEDPNETQLRKITANMFAELTQGIAIAPESIPSAWLEKLSGCSVRDTRIAMQQALGRAAIRAATSGKATMSLDGMDMQPSPKERLRKRIGFVG
jgi:ATP-dependent Lon protease